MFDTAPATDSAAPPATAGRIGPNAILQLLPVLEAYLGAPATAQLLREAHIEQVPDGTCMIDEAPVAALHQALRRAYPQEAPHLARDAGARTAEYILAHRIPAPARALLRVLPAALAEPLLLKAITAHSWTFAGSGEFAVVGRRPTRVALRHNPVVSGEQAAAPVCAWHAAVFARLYEALVGRGFTVRETSCEAAGGEACCFEITRRRSRGTPARP